MMFDNLTLYLQNDHTAMSELQYDIWELFIKYIHEGASDKVDLPSEISCEFSEAVEKHDCELLDRCLEKVLVSITSLKFSELL